MSDMKILSGEDLHKFDPKAHDVMKDVGRIIAEALQPSGQGFVLITFGFGPGGRMEYMSNGNRDDVIRLLDEFIAHIKMDAPGTE